MPAGKLYGHEAFGSQAARARAGERESESERARELERESGRGGTGREREREIGAGKGREGLPIQHSCPHLDSRAGSMRPSKPSWFDKTVCPDLPNTVLFQFDILRKDVEPSLKPQEDWVKRSKLLRTLLLAGPGSIDDE